MRVANDTRPLLVIALALVCGGCIYLPQSPRPLPEQPDAIRMIGNLGSERLIRPGTSKQEVIDLLGMPARRSFDGDVLVYGFKYVRGRWVGFLPRLQRADESVFDPIARYRWYTVRLDFNDAAELASFRLHHTDEYPRQLHNVDLGALDRMLPPDEGETLLEGYKPPPRRSARAR